MSIFTPLKYVRFVNIVSACNFYFFLSRSLNDISFTIFSTSEIFSFFAPSYKVKKAGKTLFYDLNQEHPAISFADRSNLCRRNIFSIVRDSVCQVNK